MFLCRCSCGKEIEVLKQNLKPSAGCRSCGHKGQPAHNRTHGQAGTPLFRIWKQMRQRCGNPMDTMYPRYGGRGIRVCERWQSFENFYADMGPRPSPGHSLDRIDVNGDYEPGNVRWATDTEQARNKRNNRHLTVGGVTKTVAEWAAESPVTYVAIVFRLRHGWTPEEAVRLPAGAKGDGRITPGHRLARRGRGTETGTSVRPSEPPPSSST